MAGTQRAQATLVALAVALLLVTGAIGVGLAVADGAFRDSTRDPLERRVAVSLADRIIAADGPLTLRENVLNETVAIELTPKVFTEQFPVSAGHDARVRLDGQTLVEVGNPTGGVTVRRIVLVGSRGRATLEPAFALDGGQDSVTLPRRTTSVVVTLDPPPDAVVHTVRLNERVVLHNRTGLRGMQQVQVSRYETARLRFVGTGSLPRGSTHITYFPETTTKAVLAVTVDE